MVRIHSSCVSMLTCLSVLALSSRFDGLKVQCNRSCKSTLSTRSSRFDGLDVGCFAVRDLCSFSTRSVESF